MSEAIWLALIVAFFGALTTYFTVRQPERMAKLVAGLNADVIKAADERADKVKTQVEIAARLLVESNARVAVSTKEIKEQVLATHIFLNSSNTRRIKRELSRERAMLVLMNEVVRLNRVGGLEPDADALSSINDTRAAIVDLETELRDQLEATKIVEISNMNR